MGLSRRLGLSPDADCRSEARGRLCGMNGSGGQSRACYFKREIALCDADVNMPCKALWYTVIVDMSVRQVAEQEGGKE